MTTLHPSIYIYSSTSRELRNRRRRIGAYNEFSNSEELSTGPDTQRTGVPRTPYDDPSFLDTFSVEDYVSVVYKVDEEPILEDDVDSLNDTECAKLPETEIQTVHRVSEYEDLRNQKVKRNRLVLKSLSSRNSQTTAVATEVQDVVPLSLVTYKSHV